MTRHPHSPVSGIPSPSLRSLALSTSVLTLITLSPVSRADVVTEGAANAVHAICPNASIDAPNDAAGALMPGGAMAVPMVVDCDRDQTVEIMVAVRTSQGDYRIAYRTKRWGASERRWDRVSIRNFVLVYSKGCAASCELVWESNYKFKLIEGKLTLIGEKRRDQSRADDATGTVSDYGSSINYLTGNELVWRTLLRKRVEKMTHFVLADLVTFENFDSDEVDEMHFHVKGMNGFIDANLQYKEQP
ncbi:MAG: hypothetical protein AAGC76_03760 [Luteibacter sp.]|uniref:hypothetical protein n=1 Tax=Luteibacter TaxID=242605 RepID=UPI0012E0350C|nr:MULTISPECIES: hypothetical protein [unclassified Luteibacter]MDQ7994950.1 hypothetical protein [Luteibacter sp.]MDQ8047535.1 hypothetical protein [Luteibacter sp.]